MDQALDLAGRPDAGIRIAKFIDTATTLACHQMTQIVDGGATPALDRHDFTADGIARHARGIAQRAEDQFGGALVVGNDLLLDSLMNRTLDGAHEARAHIDSLGTKCQRRNQSACITEAARGDHRDLDLVGCSRDQDEAGCVVFAGMAGTFEAIDRNRIGADPLGLQGMTHRGALVDHLDTGLLQLGDVLLRIVAGGLDDANTRIDDRLTVLGIRRRRERRQNRQVHAEGFVGQFATAGDFTTQIIRRGLREGGDEAQRTGVCHRRNEFGTTDPLHAALHDRMLDAEHFGKSGFNHDCSCRVSRKN